MKRSPGQMRVRVDKTYDVQGLGAKIIMIYSDTEIRCSRLRCRKLLGIVSNDGQALHIGATVFWSETRFTCECGKPFRWLPKRLDEGLTGERRVEQLRILNSLGRA